MKGKKGQREGAEGSQSNKPRGRGEQRCGAVARSCFALPAPCQHGRGSERGARSCRALKGSKKTAQKGSKNQLGEAEGRASARWLRAVRHHLARGSSLPPAGPWGWHRAGFGVPQIMGAAPWGVWVLMLRSPPRSRGSRAHPDGCQSLCCGGCHHPVPCP